MAESDFDPFARGPFPAGVRTVEASDTARARTFSCEIWYPAAAAHQGQDLDPATQDVFMAPLREVQFRQRAVRDAGARPGRWPLALYSHPSGAHRRAATFLCTHLASHGYVVAALDHSEVIAAELSRQQGETEPQKTARWKALMDSRVPDLRLLLDRVLAAADVDAARIGAVGHSLGGWTVLQAVEAEARIASIVALAPGGASRPRPGILPAKLDFRWPRDIPTLYLVGEDDASLPLSGMLELFQRTPAAKRMLILRRADHMHFMDDVEALHEAVRGMPLQGELSWLAQQMRPIAELCTGAQAHLFVRGLAVAHLDATLKNDGRARAFMESDLESALRDRGVEAVAHRS